MDKDGQSWEYSLNNWATETLFVDREVLLDLGLQKKKRKKKEKKKKKKAVF